MQEGHYLVFMGGSLILVGLALYFWGRLWGRRQETRYSESILCGTEAKEFLKRRLKYSGPLALKVGGAIAIAGGVLLLVLDSVFLR